MSVGYMYILSNPAMPGLLKIGITNRDVKERVAELSAATGVPKPFEIEYYCLTRDVEQVEERVHRHFSTYRSRGREFFSVPVVEAVRVVDSLVKRVEPDRFSRVTEQTPHPSLPPRTRARKEKPFDPDRLTRWQQKRYNSKKPL